MSDQWLLACSKALSHAVKTREVPLREVLLQRMHFELRQLVSPQVGDMAILCRDCDGALLCGRESSTRGLPIESIVGLLLETVQNGLEYRVTDHALDPIRSIDSGGGCRTSIVVRFRMSEAVVKHAEGALWIGLLCGVAPSHLAEARDLARTLESWFACHGDIISWADEIRQRAVRVERQLDEASSLAHDARAPLASLKSLLQQGLRAAPDTRRELEVVADEFEYLESLLSRCSPRVLQASSPQYEECVVGSVIERVVGRFRSETRERGITIRVVGTAAHLRSQLPALELERVLVNVLGNSLRYGARNWIELLVREEVHTARVAVSISDDGPGFSAQVLTRFNDRDEALGEGSSGWGIGLLSSRRRLEARGATMELLFAEGGGALVSLGLPLARSRRKGLQESGADHLRGEGVRAEGDADVFVVDDDAEHAHSLVKTLSSRGKRARSFASISEVLDQLPGKAVVVLCDATMPDGGAEQLLMRMQQRKLNQRVGVMSGDSSDDLLYRVASVGAQAFFSKPVAIEEVLDWV